MGTILSRALDMVNSVGCQRSQQMDVTTDKQEKKKHLSANESTSVNS